MVTKGEGTDVGVLEVWEGARCVTRLTVPSTLHGDIINDGLFSGGASWSNNEKMIAYVADVRPLFDLI